MRWSCLTRSLVPLRHTGDGEPAPGGTARSASRKGSDAARSLVAASSATDRNDGSPAAATTVCGVERLDHGPVGLGPDHYVAGQQPDPAAGVERPIRQGWAAGTGPRVLHFNAPDRGSVMTSMMTPLHRVVRVYICGASAPDRRLVRVGEASFGCEVACVRIPRFHLRSGRRHRW